MGRASRRKRGRDDRSRAPAAAFPARGWRGKLSEALVELIAPFRDDVQDLHACRVLITTAAFAWNLTRLPADERDAALRQAIVETNVPDGDMLEEVVTLLMQRKLELFPDDERLVASYEVTESAGDYHVQVASIS